MRTKILAALMAAAVMTGGTAYAGWANYADAYAGDSKKSERAEREADLYEDGMGELDDEEYESAIKHFAKVAEMQGSRADGALYWMAYAMNKSGRRDDALRTIETLKKAYPKSQWIDDADALALEVRQRRGEKISPERSDSDEIKVMAIHSLMNTDPERAFPLLEKILKGTGSRKVKESALFVLSQSGSPKAQALMGDLARGNAHPELQKEAIRYLGVSGGSRNRALLEELYNSNASISAKEEVLQAFMISGDRTRIANLAKTEKNPKLRKEAINLLGVMGGRSELHAMYASETSTDLREEIINAMFVAGDYQRISEIARTEKNMELRIEAIQRLGVMGKKTADTLLALYTENNMEVKNAVLDGLFVQGNARALIDLSKKETNRELKREILQKLSVMNNKEAVDYMLELLNE